MTHSSKTKRIAGVLGGMGPDATVDFMSKVMAATPVRHYKDHARMLVDHNPSVPSRQSALLGTGEDPGPTMAAMAKGLQTAGADFLVMPCNTAHAFASAIREAITIPLVSIIDVTVEACRDHGVVGVLATGGCLDTAIYQDALSNAGLEFVLPDQTGIDELMHLIDTIRLGDQSAAIAREMQSAANQLVSRGARAIIAGCTEIPLVLSADMLDVPLISSTDVLAEVTAAICAGKRDID